MMSARPDWKVVIESDDEHLGLWIDAVLTTASLIRRCGPWCPHPECVEATRVAGHGITELWARTGIERDVLKSCVLEELKALNV